MLKLSLFVFLLLVLPYFSLLPNALECYTGYSVVRGNTVGTTKETCKKDTDQCYKASVEATMLNKLKLAGCSTYRCMLASNSCAAHTIAGQHVELCCCSKDLCNAHQPKAIVDRLKGVLNGITAGKGNGILNNIGNGNSGN